MPVHPDLLRPFTGDRTVKNSRRSEARTNQYDFGEATAKAVAFYYLDVFRHLLTVVPSLTYTKKVMPLRYRDMVREVDSITPPHTVESRTVLVDSDRQIELFLERDSFLYNLEGTPKIWHSRWSVILVTVKETTSIPCWPDFETTRITIPKRVTGWLARNRSVPSDEVQKRLRRFIIPKTVLPSCRKAWEKCISDATITALL